MPVSETFELTRRTAFNGRSDLFAGRYEAPEWLDQGRGTPADVAANLAEMAQLNRYLGGFSALTRHLYPAAQGAGAAGPVTVLDLGTGSAELLAVIARWAQARKVKVRLVGLDRAGRSLDVARAHLNGTASARLLRAEAGCLPLPPQSVDFVVSSLFMHHFAPEALALLLRSAFAVARRGLIMSDLVRGRLPALAFTLAGPVFARNALTRHDGALSIRRSYTPRELRAIAAEAGLGQARVFSHWPWRVTLVAGR